MRKIADRLSALHWLSLAVYIAVVVLSVAVYLNGLFILWKTSFALFLVGVIAAPVPMLTTLYALIIHGRLFI